MEAAIGLVGVALAAPIAAALSRVAATTVTDRSKVCWLGAAKLTR
jgi:hypothetical protein